MHRVDECLFASVSSDINIIEDICSYTLQSGGKRFRPLILLLAARFCNYHGEKHIPLACVIEYLHTATLLHDDVIDHAEMRRGSSSANSMWGNQATILAGDFLFARSFAMAVEAHDLKVLEVIASTSKHLAEAEMFQVSKADDPTITEEEYFFIIKNKTASLIAASSRIGALLGGVPEPQEKALETYGFNLGIAFQIMDDVLDYRSTEKEFGKAIGKDLQEGSFTLPFIESLQRSSPEDRERMIHIVHKEERSSEDLGLIIKLIEQYGGTTYALEKADQYARQAINALDIFNANEKKKPLIDLARFVVHRNY